ncbi:MAG: CBS domain-containing protein, partial [SAR324 cluster bacterium]|nr:CBS domain-containing protein [SAR324 cluster bacterium]
MKDITVQPDLTIRQAMKALDRTAEKCLLVVDENNKLLGTLTDGDLRRSILGGIKFSEGISNSYYIKPSVLLKDTFSENEAKQMLRDRKL